MHYTILEQMQEAPVLDWEYVGPTDVDVKVKGAPRWLWLEDVLSKIPEGQCIRFPVPEGDTCAHVQNNLRAALGMARMTCDWKWSIRQSKDDRSVIVLKGEKWPTFRDNLRSLGKYPNVAQEAMQEVADRALCGAVQNVGQIKGSNER